MKLFTWLLFWRRFLFANIIYEFCLDIENSLSVNVDYVLEKLPALVLSG